MNVTGKVDAGGTTSVLPCSASARVPQRTAREARRPTTEAHSDGTLAAGWRLRHTSGMTSSDAKPSRRGEIIYLLFVVIGTPVAVVLLFLLF